MSRRFCARSGTESVALAASILTVLTLIILVFYAQVSATNLNAQSTFLGSSSLSSNGRSTTAQQAVPAPAGQYPLVLAPNSPTEGNCDTMPFCIYAMLGFAATATLPPPPPPPPTTVIQNNTTTILISSTTTYISGISTGVDYPPENDSYSVTVFVFVQDAVTGQNVTTSSGRTYFGGGCAIQEFGYTECIAPGSVPPGHTYKITVYVTKGDLPCALRPADQPSLQCVTQLLAPVSPTITASW